MNTVVQLLTKEIKNQQSRFVFPSETAASLWARKSLALTGERTAALNRFLAWDRFKEGIIRSEKQDKQPVSSVIRKLFVEDLVKRNAQAAAAGRSLLRSLIPPEYAAGGGIFSTSIAAMLPSLGFWENRLEHAGIEADEEDRDLLFLKKEYAAFLDRHSFFEPSWEHPPLGDREHHYYIFFPEAMEDFTEYESILSGEDTIHIINLAAGRDEAPPGLYRAASARAEIRSAALEILRLHEEEGIPYPDMAVSVPRLEDAEPYLLRELALHNIPVRRRWGKPLAEYGTGKLFALISACAAGNFTFASLKSLLMDEQIPWRYPERNRELIEFGVQNNCVSPYREKGVRVDIWIEAFRSAPREERLANYYKQLKGHILSMTRARNFAEIRLHYFSFRGEFREQTGDHPQGRFLGFLAQEACSAEGDAVMARCIEELSALAQLEEDYPDLVPPSPFAFFLKELQEKQYVPQRRQRGVNIFPGRVAAAAPFACHFVLNAAQNAATVLYRPLRFLRRDKRELLGAADADASAVFFTLYWGYTGEAGELKRRVRISAADLSFSGWAIPHSFFTGKAVGAAEETASPADLYRRERDWWGGGSAAFPARLFPAQKQGFERWSGTLLGQAEKGLRLLKAPFPAGELVTERLREQVHGVQERKTEEGEALTKVSATDMNAFFSCPALWLFQKVWRLRAFVPEAKLMDEASLGLLYHAVLKDLFARIREEDRFFEAAHLDKYRRWAGECTDEAVRQYPAFQGPLAVPLMVSQAEAVTRRIRGLLETEAKYFAGYAVAELEAGLEIRRGGVLLNGRLDRVSVSPDDGPVIIDYKTGQTPTKAGSTAGGDTGLRDFQMPMYIKLYEEQTGKEVEGAFFVSINRRELGAVIGSPQGKRGHTREAYQTTLDALDIYIEDFCKAVAGLDFAPKKIPLAECFGCEYKTVCRTVYSLNAVP